ncbi:MAG: trypsin-like peptidase domain-containing protein [archaeon]|nr:trypsin-like peptidase domain-containing protein [archaeon]
MNNLKPQHKIMIGGLSVLLIIAIMANSIFIYMLFVKTNVNYDTLDKKIVQSQVDTQTKINELTQTLLQTKEQIGSLDTQLTELKATASSDFSGIIEDVIPSVVTIRTDVAQGTGFIITQDGYIVTNAHVLSGGHEVYAITSNQESKGGKLIGYNEMFDLALLKIDGNYQALELANSDDVQTGEKVIAIGNPLGLQFSVSEGIVSGVHRPGINNLEIYIQTDAALNPGNSGGPLINKKGEAIGMNNFKAVGSENLGFALESNYIKKVVNMISAQKLNETILP